MRALLAAAVALALLVPLTLSAQRARKPAARPAAPAKKAAPPATPRRAERPVPFTVGETLTYDVSWSSYVTAGTATAIVKEKRPSFGSTAYYIVAEGKPTPLVGKLYSLYYKMDTLLDSFTLLPQRGSVYSEEGKRRRFKVSQFDHAKHKVFFEYESSGKVTDTFTVPSFTQDALSALYVLRAVPMKSGDRITMPVTDDGTNYKVQVDVAPPEPIKTPYTRVAAWKLKLSIADAAGKAQGRNIAVWLSDDARRLPMKLQAVARVGSFDLNLRDVK